MFCNKDFLPIFVLCFHFPQDVFYSTTNFVFHDTLLPLCLCVYEYRRPQRPEEDTELLGAGVTGSCEIPTTGTEN